MKRLMGMEVPRFHPCSWATDVLRSETCDPTRASMMICGAWALWTGRNGRRHGRKIWEPGGAARYVSKLIEELVSLRPIKEPKHPLSVRARWEKPEPGWTKVNTDGGFDQQACSGRTGVVIRDHTGVVVGAAARWFDDVESALAVEALAAREGLELASELGLGKVILEVDCQVLARFLLDPNSVYSTIGSLCLDIIELGKGFSDFQVCWVGRDANAAAHVCAATISATERSFFWLDVIPDWLADLAIADCIPSDIE